jgi:hypothetical protein
MTDQLSSLPQFSPACFPPFTYPSQSTVCVATSHLVCPPSHHCVIRSFENTQQYLLLGCVLLSNGPQVLASLMPPLVCPASSRVSLWPPPGWTCLAHQPPSLNLPHAGKTSVGQSPEELPRRLSRWAEVRWYQTVAFSGVSNPSRTLRSQVWWCMSIIPALGR